MVQHSPPTNDDSNSPQTPPVEAVPEQHPAPPPVKKRNIDDTIMHTLVQGANSAILTASELPFGTQVGSATTYRVLPSRLADSAQSRAVRWRVELHGLDLEVAPLGLDIVGDVIMGRGGLGGDEPDLDLDPFGAVETGVSRHHAMLRPSRNSLYLIDLNSTNGTWHNAMRLNSGITRALANNDTITLGRLTFTIRIMGGSVQLPPAAAAPIDTVAPVDVASPTASSSPIDAAAIKPPPETPAPDASNNEPPSSKA